MTPGTPIPTPWPKEEFDRYVLAMQERRRKIRADNRPEAEMDALFKEQMAHDVAMLNAPALKGVVGAFEGANYESRGYYRPQTDCIMFYARRRRLLRGLPARDRGHFGPV